MPSSEFPPPPNSLSLLLLSPLFSPSDDSQACKETEREWGKRKRTKEREREKERERGRECEREGGELMRL